MVPGSCRPAKHQQQEQAAAQQVAELADGSSSDELFSGGKALLQQVGRWLHCLWLSAYCSVHRLVVLLAPPVHADDAMVSEVLFGLVASTLVCS